MNTVNLVQAILNWVLSDPSHIVAAASGLAAITPTPAANTWAGQLYKILDLFALNFLHAKDK